MPITTRVLGKFVGEAGTSTSFNVPLDFTPAAGEYITVRVSHSYDSGSVATVAGYGAAVLDTTDIKTQFAPYLVIHAKFAGSSEPDSITINKSAANADYNITVLGHTGVDPANPLCGTAKAVDGGGSATGNAPSLTPTFQPCRVIFMTASQNYRAAADSTYSWTGATKIADTISVFNISTSAYEDRTSLTATGTRGWTIGNYGGNTPAMNATLALREQVAAPIVPVLPVVIDAIQVDGTASPATLTTPAFVPEANEIIIAFSIAGHTSVTVGAATNNAGLTVTNRDSSATASYTPERMDIIRVGSNPPASMTVSGSFTGSATINVSLFVVRLRGKLAATPAVQSIKTGTATAGSPVGTPNATVTTTGVNSGVLWLAGDWVPVTTGTPTYRSGATELKKRRTSGVNFWLAFQPAAAAGAQTIGMTAPTGQKWTMLGLEVLGSDPVPETGRHLLSTAA